MKPGPKANQAMVDRDRLLFNMWRQLTSTHTLAQIGQMVPGCEHLTVARLSQIILREEGRNRAVAEREGG